MAGVTTRQFKEFQLEKKLNIPANVILEVVQMISVVATGCHVSITNVLKHIILKNGHCYSIVRFCVCYILTLCFCCVVCFLSYLSVNSHYYKTCHGTFLSQINVFSFDVISVILIGFCLLLSSFLCALNFNVVSLFSSYF